MSFVVSADTRSNPLTRDNVETFTEGALLTRQFRRKNGSTSISTVEPLVTSSSDIRSAYDLSWLRSPDHPAKGRGRPVVVADLFAGCGGLSLGVAEACRALNRRVEHAFTIEIDETASDVYSQNFPSTPLQVAPIETVVDGALGTRKTTRERRLLSQLSDLDLVIAGPPCQGHSDLNNHTRRNDPATTSTSVRLGSSNCFGRPSQSSKMSPELPAIATEFSIKRRKPFRRSGTRSQTGS